MKHETRTNFKTNIMKDDGWNNYYSIADASAVKCGEMICDKCGKKIRSNSLYLIKDRTNWKHRGNETDERYLYHRDCSPIKSVWEKHDKEAKKAKKEAKIRDIKIAELKAEISAWGFSQDDLF